MKNLELRMENFVIYDLLIIIDYFSETFVPLRG